ncbi:HU family DNA-binding protein [Cupriavidus metallidurans]|uniref:HU family DNA-binding protein n=1 Tax=Cupriavidus metallidurans TaxID=119219 RepID=A0A482ISQ8_9BURK|nr:HU family DNA-binding protein [Cupriavidus metallidurans]QBP09820.1 HU family DNA-binding protein [Cupriavidus metallidurans]
MNKSELIDHVAKQTGLTKVAAGNAVDAVLSGITRSMKEGNDVALVGFGTFSVGQRDAREGRNPQTGESITVPARKVPKFKAGTALKAAVN